MPNWLEKTFIPESQDFPMREYQDLAEYQKTWLDELMPTELDFYKNKTMPQRESFDSFMTDYMKQPLGVPADLSNEIWRRAQEKIKPTFDKSRESITNRAAGANMLGQGPTNQLLADVDLSEAKAVRDTAVDQAVMEFEQTQKAQATKVASMMRYISGNTPGMNLPSPSIPGSGGGYGGGAGGNDLESWGQMLGMGGQLLGVDNWLPWDEVTLPGFGEGGAASNALSSFFGKGAAAAPAAAPGANALAPGLSMSNPATMEAFAAGTPAPGGFAGSGAAAAIGTGAAVGAAAVIAKQGYNLLKSMGKNVYLDPAQVAEKIAVDVPDMPQTGAAMVAMRSSNVWNEEKNYIEHVENVNYIKDLYQSAGQQFNPQEWDQAIADLMLKGLSANDERTELVNLAKARGVNVDEIQGQRQEDEQRKAEGLNGDPDQYKAKYGIFPWEETWYTSAPNGG